MEVRCCCDAGKLLGTVPEDIPTGAGSYRWRFVTGEILELPLARWFDVEVHRAGESFRDGGWALKSNDTPIEVLRQIPGWQDAKR